MRGSILNELEHIMKTRTIVAAMVAVSLAASGVAFGQGNSGRDGDRRGGNDQGRRDDRGDRGRSEQVRQDQRAHDRRDERSEGRGAGPNHAFYRGDRLPVEYRHRYYVVDDWRGHELRRPPRGYHWVQTGGDYILVAVATGVILDVFL